MTSPESCANSTSESSALTGRLIYWTDRPTEVQQVVIAKACTSPPTGQCRLLVTRWAVSKGFDSLFSHRSPAPRTGDGAQRTAHHHVQIRDDEGGQGARTSVSHNPCLWQPKRAGKPARCVPITLTTSAAGPRPAAFQNRGAAAAHPSAQVRGEEPDKSSPRAWQTNYMGLSLLMQLVRQYGSAPAPRAIDYFSSNARAMVPKSHIRRYSAGVELVIYSIPAGRLGTSYFKYFAA
jgi:hypothetical protein